MYEYKEEWNEAIKLCRSVMSRHLNINLSERHSLYNDCRSRLSKS